MAPSTYFLLFTILCHLSNLAISVDEGFNNVIYHVGFGNSSNLIPNPNYQNNIQPLLTSLISQSSLGFFNTSVGEVPNVAYGSFLCRGDLSADQCNDCLENVRRYMSNRPISMYETNGIAFDMQLECMVHYANTSSAFVYRENSTFTGRSIGDNLARHPQYNTTLWNTLEQLTREAGDGNWSRPNFNSTVVNVVGTGDMISILVQCTPDISATNCSSCIRDLYTSFRPTLIAENILGTNCLLKYNNEPFMSSGYPKFMPSYFHATLVFIFTIWLILA